MKKIKAYDQAYFCQSDDFVKDRLEMNKSIWNERIFTTIRGVDR